MIVGVFQGRPKPPPYATPIKPLHITKLESNSTGSSFPADLARPVPRAEVSPDSRQGQWESLWGVLGFGIGLCVLTIMRTVDPFMRVTN